MAVLRLLSAALPSSFLLLPYLILIGALLIPPVSTQQGPAYLEPAPFHYGLSHRQSVCDRQRLLHNGTVELRKALQGLDLRMLIVAGRYVNVVPANATARPRRPRRPGSAEDEAERERNPIAVNGDGWVIDPDDPSIIPILLDEVARRGGFEWRDSFGMMGSATVPDDQTFDELLRWSVETYDVSAAWWIQAVERMAMGASFPTGWNDASLVLVWHAEGVDGDTADFKAFSFLEPFHWGVWVMIVITVATSGLIYWHLEKLDDESDAQDLSRKPLANLYLSSLMFTGHSEFQPSTGAARLFTFSLAFWALLTASAYTANLASFLVTENSPKTTIGGLDDVVKMGKVICVVANTRIDQQVQNAYGRAILMPVTADKDVVRGIREGTCSYGVMTLSTWNELERMREHNEGCRLSWIGRVFRFQEGGFAVKSDSGSLCTSLIRDVLNVHLAEMKEEGDLATEWQKHLDRQSDLNCEASRGGGSIEEVSLLLGKGNDGSMSSFMGGDSAQLDMRSMGGLFIIHFFLVFVSYLMALWRLWKKDKNIIKALSVRHLSKKKSDGNVSSSSGIESTSRTVEEKIKSDDPEGTLGVSEEAEGYKALYEEQSRKVDELREQMRHLLAAVDNLTNVPTSSGVRRRRAATPPLQGSAVSAVLPSQSQGGDRCVKKSVRFEG